MILKALIVDDTIIYRKILTDATSAFSCIKVIGTAPSGEIALKKISFDKPDIVFLDVHMPGMNGIETLKQIKNLYPEIAVVMVSSISTRGTSDTIEALQIGAIDFIRKPDGKDMRKNTEQLHNDIKSLLRFFEIKRRTLNIQNDSMIDVTGGTTLQKKIATPVSSKQISKYKSVQKVLPGKSLSAYAICAIGVSTGGPEALSKLIPKIPEDFPIPIVLVQHMPPIFTKSLAESLTRRSKVKVIEAEDNLPVTKGTVVLAPGGRHMVIRNINGILVTGINDEPPENSCRPSIDVLFRSVAAHYGENGVLAVILTGMGNDGLNGVRTLKRKKCTCLTQSESSCVVYGMPRAVVEAGLSDKSLHLEMIADEIISLVYKKSFSPINVA
ncbi:MAG: chemotaxis-specific protein-glutamate methyltransferase CheB [Chitinispirillaceae bacterium]|nr:chemotaxis-specific protein-glutamate methyltransferase CheB [Chitinispirillaceae bacterium]